MTKKSNQKYQGDRGGSKLFPPTCLGQSNFLNSAVETSAGSNAEIGHRESPVSETGVLGVPRRVRLTAKQLRVLEVPGNFQKSTVLLCRKHEDPGRAGFESGISFYVLLKFYT